MVLTDIFAFCSYMRGTIASSNMNPKRAVSMRNSDRSPEEATDWETSGDPTAIKEPENIGIFQTEPDSDGSIIGRFGQLVEATGPGVKPTDRKQSFTPKRRRRQIR